ncbi:MAG: protein kinase domain-containing protein [Candidatus Eiseniibacteriota bacterium]
MDSTHWQRLEGIFLEALEKDAAELPSFLDRAAGGDAELRAEVEEMLAAHSGAERLAIESMLSEGDADRAPAVTHAGPFRLVERIGRGGMGEVFRAERDDGQFEQTVAVKLIRTGIATPELLRRFRAERQILARLQHPHIARLHDGGVTDGGLPWLAMEHVAGRTITEHCEAQGLPVEARLALFAAVCRVVQYAHQNLVVHRDLKPSNILVTASGEPKLLDFGVAKLLEAEDAGPAATTRTVLELMTPRYAGGAWSSLSSSSIAPNTLNDVWTFDEDFAVGVGENGAVVQRGPSGWFDVVHGLTTEDLWGIWASGPGDIWAVGSGGVVLHGDGSTWSLVDTGPDDFDHYGVGGNAPDNVWVVGADALWHWDGAAWTNRFQELPDTSSSYNKVWVAPTGDVFIVGDDFVHFDGAAWERIPVKAASGGAYLYDVWGASANDVWVTGYPGVFHWDGTEATLRWFTGSDDPVAITGTSGRNIVACGDGGVVQFADGVPAQFPAGGGDLVGAGTGVDGVTYLVGADGAIVRVE